MSGFGILGTNRPTADDIADVLEAAAGSAEASRIQASVSGDVTPVQPNATPEVMAAISRETAAGGGLVTLHPAPGGSAYALGRPVADSQRGVPIPSGISLDGNGSALTLLDNSDFLYIGRPIDGTDTTYVSFFGVAPGVDYAQVVGDIVAGADTLAVSLGDEAAFELGESVYVRLNQAQYDYQEPSDFFYAHVRELQPGMVRLDRGVPNSMVVSVSLTAALIAGESLVSADTAGLRQYHEIVGDGVPAGTFAGEIAVGTFRLVDAYGNRVVATATHAAAVLTAQVGARQRRIISVRGAPSNITVRGLNLIGSASGQANAESGVHVRYGRGIDIEQVSGEHVGAGLVLLQFAENISVRQTNLRACSYRGQASKGRMFGFAECRNVHVDQYIARGFEGVVAFVEAGSENIVMRGGDIVNTAIDRPSETPLYAMSGSDGLLVDGAEISGAPCVILEQYSVPSPRGGYLRNVNVSSEFSPSFDAMPKWFRNRDVAENVVMGNWFRFSKRQKSTIAIALQPLQGFRGFDFLPRGVYTKISFVCTNKTGLTSLVLTDLGFTNVCPIGSPATIPNALVNGIPFDLPETNEYPWWSFGGGHPLTNPTASKVLYYQSDASVAPGAMLYVSIEYFPAGDVLVRGDVEPYIETS